MQISVILSYCYCSLSLIVSLFSFPLQLRNAGSFHELSFYADCFKRNMSINGFFYAQNKMLKYVRSSLKSNVSIFNDRALNDRYCTRQTRVSSQTIVPSGARVYLFSICPEWRGHEVVARDVHKHIYTLYTWQSCEFERMSKDRRIFTRRA